jgi:hypothetical protein
MNKTVAEKVAGIPQNNHDMRLGFTSPLITQIMYEIEPYIVTIAITIESINCHITNNITSYVCKR